MKPFFTLFAREVLSFFYSPIAYVVLFYFLLLTGYNFWSLVTGYSVMHIPVKTSLVEEFFKSAPFWFPFILSFPLITMRVYSEEFRMGTIETLTTAPVHDWQIVLAKFFGVLFFYCVLWAPSFCIFVLFEAWTGQAAVAATGAYGSTYLLLLLIGAFFISIGCLASALTKDQINAATISFTTITLVVFASFLPLILNISAPPIRELFDYISPMKHMKDYSEGLMDSRPLVWYSSMTVLVCYLTLQVFQFRKWKA